MPGGVPNHQRRRVGIVQRVPDHVEPVRVAELLRLVPLVGGQPDGLTALATLDLDPAHAGHRVPVARLWVRRRQAANVEADLLVADPLAPPAPGLLPGDDPVPGRRWRRHGRQETPIETSADQGLAELAREEGELVILKSAQGGFESTDEPQVIGLGLLADNDALYQVSASGRT